MNFLPVAKHNNVAECFFFEFDENGKSKRENLLLIYSSFNKSFLNVIFCSLKNCVRSKFKLGSVAVGILDCWLFGWRAIR